MSPIASAATPGVPRPDEIFDPVGRGLDVIGDRWTLLLIRHLLGAHRGFQELRKRTGIAPRVLSSRLRQLAADGFVESVADGSRSLYALTPQGRSLAPIIAAIGRWWICHGLRDLDIDPRVFTRTSAQSVIESLPFMVNSERSGGVDLVFELRLTGEGGGVWTVHVQDGVCDVRSGFSERANVRYTADAKIWCGVALGLIDAADLFKRGLLLKEGGLEAMDHYFHQVSPEGRARPVDQVLPHQPSRGEPKASEGHRAGERLERSDA